MKKVFIRTFGCQMNEYDSEKMLAVLAEENGGIEQVTEADEADASSRNEPKRNRRLNEYNKINS